MTGTPLTSSKTSWFKYPRLRRRAKLYPPRDRHMTATRAGAGAFSRPPSALLEELVSLKFLALLGHKLLGFRELGLCGAQASEERFLITAQHRGDGLRVLWRPRRQPPPSTFPTTCPRRRRSRRRLELGRRGRLGLIGCVGQGCPRLERSNESERTVAGGSRGVPDGVHHDCEWRHGRPGPCREEVFDGGTMANGILQERVINATLEFHNRGLGSVAVSPVLAPLQSATVTPHQIINVSFGLVCIGAGHHCQWGCGHAWWRRQRRHHARWTRWWRRSRRRCGGQPRCRARR